MRNTLQDLEREKANPHLLAALGATLPGLSALDISYEEGGQDRPEEALRRDPAFQQLLQATGGEIVDSGRMGRA